MSEMLMDGYGNAYPLKVNSDGSLNITGSVLVNGITFSGTLLVDDVNGTMYMVSGNAWSGIGSVIINPLNKISTLNSYSGLIAVNGSWVGTYENALNYSSIANLNIAGATGSLYIDYSDVGVNTLRSSLSTSASGTAYYTSVTPRTQYYRFRYMNGNTANQFYITTMLSETERGATYRPLVSPLTDTFTVLSTKSVLSAKCPAGSYINIDCTNGGNLKMSVEDWNGVVGSMYVLNTAKTNSYIVSGNAWNDVGSVYQIVTAPISNYNPIITMTYSGGLIGSIFHNSATNNLVKVLTYDINDNLITVGSWCLNGT